MTRAQILGPMPINRKAQRLVKPDPGLPPFLAALYELPLLSGAQERHLFRKFNYLRWKRSRAKLPERYDAPIEEVRNLLIESNLRLAVHFAKTWYPNDDLNEKISHAYLGIVKSVDGFDYGRGWKFSTYASNAIKMQFRNAWRTDERAARLPTQQVDDMGAFSYESDITTEIQSRIDADTVRGYLKVIKDDRIRFVVRQRFGIGVRAKILEELGAMMGITKERVRQIEAKGLNIIRNFAMEQNNERRRNSPTYARPDVALQEG